MNRSRTAFAVGLVVPLLVLSGCSSDDPQPKIAPPETTAPTQTTSPTPSGPVEPTMPAAAKQQSAAGAEAFVAYFWEVANYAQATGDIASLEDLTTSTCEACQGATSFLRGVYRRGGTVTGGESSVSKLRSEKLFAGNKVFYRVTFTVTNTRQRVDEPGGDRDRVYPAASVTDRFVLNRVDGQWRLAIWEVLA